MIKYFSVLWCVIQCTYCGFGQSSIISFQEIDSLYLNGNYEEIVNQLDQLKTKAENSLDEVSAWIYLGRAYNKLGDYNKGLTILNKVLFRAASATDYHKIQAYGQKGKILEALGKNWDAIKAYKKVVEFYEKENNPKTNLVYVDALSGISEVESKLGDDLRALDYAQRSLEAYQQLGKKDKEPIVEATKMLQIAILLKKNSQTEMAQKYVEYARKLSLGNDEDSNLEWSEFYSLLSVYYLKLPDFRQSLQYNTEAMQQIMPDFKPNNKYQLPDISLLESTNSINISIDLLEFRAKVFRAEYSLNEQVETLENALTIYEMLDQLLSRLRRFYIDQRTRLAWGD
ncbi:MAG: tetratricopeptide repeat protein [Aureispira sp.]|nr:tetratricopeptide repeat protein [Aureispira sp.]